MRQPWSILEQRTSAREVVALLLAIPVAVVGGVQAIFAFVFSVDKRARLLLPLAVSAGQGDLAAGRDISGSTINTLPSPGAPRR